MSKSEEIIQAMRDEGHIDATLVNTVSSPLGSASDDMFAVRFATYMPAQVQFSTYQASLTVLVSIDGGTAAHYPVKPSPAAGVTVNVPPGTKHFYATVKDVSVSDASYAMIVTAF